MKVKGLIHDFDIAEDRNIIDCDNRPYEWTQDNDSFCLIRVVDDHIEVLYVKDGIGNLQFNGKEPEQIMKAIASQNILNNYHIAYIGLEVSRAKECMREGKKYVQDQYSSYKKYNTQ